MDSTITNHRAHLEKPPAKSFKSFFAALMVCALLIVFSHVAHADNEENRDAPAPPPPNFNQMQSWLKIKDEDDDEHEEEAKKKIGVQIRVDALKEAALSYGARGGLAWRTFQIQRRLAENEGNISKIFNFGNLLIAAPSGLMIEPPVVTEAQKAVIINSGGQNAAVADRVYRINRNARIVTAPKNWRAYLERDWGRVEPPPSALVPKNEEELLHWRRQLALGWEEGIKQADDIFQADLDRLNTDYLGMVRYRELLAQGIITPPYATQEDRGVTGGGSEMRIGDRGLVITGPSQFNPKSERWITAPR
ncbi:MAG: type IV secretory system conjugative DNA transfer family protein [Alphaproteobacteria bacterium]|nr:type IV secretory system conjugative DNA transfer family protein [Alphaproteobacteria bacterium]